MEAVDVMAAALRMQAAGEPYALVSVLHAEAPVAARPGDKAVVDADGRIVSGWIGGGCAQPAVQKAALRSLADGKARRLRIANAPVEEVRESEELMEVGMTCHSGGLLELFVDPILPLQRLVIIGESPFAVALSKLAPVAGFAVTVAARAESRDAFAAGCGFIDLDETQAARASLHHNAWVVVATQGRGDLEALRIALEARPRYLGFVASARKAEVLRGKLRDAGFAAQAVASIVAPVGVAIHARTPEEIAVSVLAALVAERRAPATIAERIPVDRIAASVAARPGGMEAGAAHAASCCQAAPAPRRQAIPDSSCCGGEHGLSA
jgi:xanthine dehydrogenase accessory factor